MSSIARAGGTQSIAIRPTGVARPCRGIARLRIPLPARFANSWKCRGHRVARVLEPWRRSRKMQFATLNLLAANAVLPQEPLPLVYRAGLSGIRRENANLAHLGITLSSTCREATRLILSRWRTERGICRPRLEGQLNDGFDSRPLILPLSRPPEPVSSAIDHDG